MSDSSKNRVTSSKTPRGSHNPHRNAGCNCIVQRSQKKSQRTATDPTEITVATVRRLLEFGEILASELTQDEIKEIKRAYDLPKTASSDRARQKGNIIGT